MDRGFQLTLEHLLVLNYVARHAEITLATVALICQQTERQAREAMRQLVIQDIVVARRRASEDYWTLGFQAARAIHGQPQEKMERFDAAERDTLSALARATEAGRRGLSVQEIRDRLGLTKDEGKYLTRRMREKI